MKKIFIGKLPENYEEKLPEKLALLNKNRADELSKRKKPTEYAISVYASAAVTELAKEFLGKDGTELVFEKDENGKPHFKGIDGLFFNISHSFPFYAAAISDRPIGIDIEKIRDVNINISKRMFTENERIYVGTDTARFFEIWTKKEAYSKFTGRGISEKFSSIDVLLPPISDNFTFTSDDGAAVAIYCEDN